MILYIIHYFIAINYADTITIKTELGAIKGTVNPTTLPSTTIYEFKGIPYSTPMIGNLRFRPSILNTSTYNGIFDATSFGHVCSQPLGYVDNQPMSEDCLFLNIWTTKSIIDQTNSNGKLFPIMFWIHGGAFTVGSGSNAQYNASNFIRKYGGEFIFVSINYRLGSLGFLQNKAIYDEDPNWQSYGGLNGIYDQIIALKWINKYISSFGGDATQITIFGESAGGLSICMLLVSSLAKHLFSNAIIESGACIAGWGPSNKTVGIEQCNIQLKEAGYPINNLTYLRSIPANEFVNNCTGHQAVDGEVLTDIPRSYYDDKSIQFNANNIIIGVNSLDGLWSWPFFEFPPYLPTNDSEYKQFIARFVSNVTQQNAIYNLYYSPSDFSSYPPDNDTYNGYEIGAATMNCDVCLTCPSLQIGTSLLEHEGNSEHLQVYMYEFLGPGVDDIFYAPHTAELIFVFDYNNKMMEQSYLFGWNQNLSNAMVSAWSNFAKYGLPNITLSSQNVDVLWDPFSINNKNVILFQANGNGIVNVNNFSQNYRDNVCRFWYEEVGLETMIKLCRAH